MEGREGKEGGRHDRREGGRVREGGRKGREGSEEIWREGGSERSE